MIEQGGPAGLEVVTDARQLERVVRSTTAARVLFHEGASPPPAALADMHAGAGGVLVERPVAGLALGTPAPPPEVWFALRRARGTSAAAECWRRALDEEPELTETPGAAHRALVTLRGTHDVRTVDSEAPTPEQARNLGRDAVRLHRDMPETMEATGLASYREVSMEAFTRRRLLRRSPGVGSRLAGVDESARRDASFWAGVHDEARPDEWRGITGAVAILMYHGFGQDEPASRYVLPGSRLRRQLRLLRLLGRRVVDLDDYVTARRNHQFVDPRSVVLTIDDGYRDTYDVAAPIFEARGASATLFVPSLRIGGANDWSDEPALAGRSIASAEQLRADGPVGIGSHARTHPALTECDPTEAAEEIAGSRDDLEEVLGRPVRTFAYPYGDEDDSVRRLVLESGFDAAVSSRGGKNLPAERLDSLRRIEIRGTDPLWRFALAVLVGSARPIATFRAGLRQ